LPPTSCIEIQTFSYPKEAKTIGEKDSGDCFVYLGGKVLKDKKTRLRLAAAVIIIIFAFCILAGIPAIRKQTGVAGQDMIIIAHRAGAASAPENTLAALTAAIADGAEIAEIDIRQMTDGTLIVMHDDNFFRTTGINLNIREAAYQDVIGLDAAAYFRGSFAGEKIPTLDEMLEASKGRIRLMIEVKVAGYEKDLEKQLVEALRLHDMEGCIIGSASLEVLRKVKEMAPIIETVYIAESLKGSDYDLDYVDSYSVKYRNINGSMVTRIHSRGKLIYGWTVNSDDNIRNLILKDVDGIVTDDVLLVRTICY